MQVGRHVTKVRDVQAVHPEHQRARAVVRMYCITGTIQSCGNVKAQITGGSHNRGVQDMRPTKSKNGLYHKDGLGTQQMTRFRSNDGMANNPLPSTLSHDTAEADVTGGNHIRGV